MQTVFSHIIQKRFSQVNEDVATDALAFILHCSESAQAGMMKLLRRVVGDIPDLQFRTQQAEGSIRPDLSGIDEAEPRVLVENKFWAGLTENQPIGYLKRLAKSAQPTILLMVVPEARESTVWRELMRRLEAAQIAATGRDATAGIVYSVNTDIGPIMALTSWRKLLWALELELADDQGARNDLLQLRALCEAADSEAFIPVSPTDASDQRTPAFILQLSSIVQSSVDVAVAEGVLNIDRLMPQASWERVGRYARLSRGQGVGVWFGIHFALWRKHGGTPLWLVFSQGEFCRAREVQSLIEPWASREGIFTTRQNDEFAVAIDMAVGEDRDEVVAVIVDRLRTIAGVLPSLGQGNTGLVR